MTTSPARMAEIECADWRKAGCLWGKGCLVADGLRCKHFEKVVLPLACSQPKYDGVREAYMKRVGDKPEGP